MAFTLHPANDPRTSLGFLSLDALAAHLVRQRPGRSLELTRCAASQDGGPMFDAVSIHAIDRRDRRAFMDDPSAFDADWLGMAHGGLAASVTALGQAIDRVRSAGGLAA